MLTCMVSKVSNPAVEFLAINGPWAVHLPHVHPQTESVKQFVQWTVTQELTDGYVSYYWYMGYCIE